MGSRSRAAATFVSLTLCAGVGCSLAVDTKGLSGGSGAGGADASLDARGSSSASSSGSGDGGGSSGDAGGCAKVRITIAGCNDATYVPKGNGSTVATRATPEVLIYGHHNAPAFGTAMTIDDRRTEPHHLVLATHDATKWTVNAKKPEALLSVVLSGYEVSAATAPNGVPVKVGAAKTPYNFDALPPDYDDLVAYAKSQTGASAVTAFAGCHDASSVLVEDACN